MRTTLGTAIHSKSGKVCGVCFSVTKNSADKMRKSWHKNFATKVPKSIKSLKMHHSKAKCIKLWHQEHVNQRFSAFCQRLFKTSGPLFVTHCRIVSFQGLRLIVFAFSENLSAENLNFLRSPDIQDIKRIIFQQPFYLPACLSQLYKWA